MTAIVQSSVRNFAITPIATGIEPVAVDKSGMHYRPAELTHTRTTASGGTAARVASPYAKTGGLPRFSTDGGDIKEAI